GVPFLPALVRAIGHGQLVSGFPIEGDPFAWADLTIYLPTRRAARAVRQVIVDSTGGAAVLPRIFPLGDLDETDTIFDHGEEPIGTREPLLPPAIGPVRRQFLLARLVTQWSGATAAAGLAGEELDTEPSAFPASPADAARLAADLAILMDQATAEGGTWADLDAAIASDHAEHWNLTGDFLKIIRSAWPAIKSELGVLDPGERRDALIRRQAVRLAENGAPKPVIAAGSTGTSPATAELLAVIANLENGALVLPGLDQQMEEAAWDAIDGGSENRAGATAQKSGAKDGRRDGNDASAGHPQYGLKQLLRTLQVPRADVVELAPATPLMAARASLLSGALSPPQAVSIGERPALADGSAPADEKPAGAAEQADKCVSNIGLIEAATEREEASAIALILRHTVENPDKIAALITPDRALARRVSVELQRWDISVDDSAGKPLLSSSPAVLAVLTARIGYRARDPHDMLALCQSAIALPGLDPAERGRAAAALERIAFRSRAMPAGRTALQDRLAAQSLAFGPKAADRGNDKTTPRTHPPQALRGLNEKDWRLASTLAEGIDRALAPMEECAGDGSVPVSFRALLSAHSETIARLDAGQPDNYPLDDSRRAMDEAMAELLDDASHAPDILAVQYPDFLTAMLAGRVVRATHIRDNRIHIWGTLEARLQHVDVAILAGLNETVWPAQTRLDPFLSRGMRTALALQPPERRIGLAAHDFTQGMGHGEIWLTHAARRGTTPQVASRWLQRFVAAAGESAGKAMNARGAYYLGIARSLDCSAAPAQAAKRPQPAPGVALRPRRLSV
ncbi:MAG: double-strand break repair protein AddB, partial [Alphaproteobacteria bacterium]